MQTLLPLGLFSISPTSTFLETPTLENSPGLWGQSSDCQFLGGIKDISAAPVSQTHPIAVPTSCPAFSTSHIPEGSMGKQPAHVHFPFLDLLMEITMLIPSWQYFQRTSPSIRIPYYQQIYMGLLLPERVLVWGRKQVVEHTPKQCQGKQMVSVKRHEGLVAIPCLLYEKGLVLSVPFWLILQKKTSLGQTKFR